MLIPAVHELDRWTDRINNTKKRADKNKVTPHGVPNDIYSHADRFGCLDFKIRVNADALETVKDLYAPANDPVFQLVPPLFEELATEIYQGLGYPDKSWSNIWAIYCDLLNRFEHLDTTPQHTREWETHVKLMDIQPSQFDAREQAPIPLMSGNELLGGIDNPRADGSYYMGGANGGLGLDSDMIQQLDEMEDNDNNFEPLEVAFSDNDDPDPDQVDDW